jgi:DNA polymerase (family 10)
VHNIELRNIAFMKCYKLSEYGLYPKESGEQIAGKSEEAIYKRASPIYLPSFGKNRGETKAAANDTLPKLIEAGDLRGNPYAHKL